jgi:hypothetical protein
VVNPDRIREREKTVLKKDLEAVWRNNPEMVFDLTRNYSRRSTYCRIIGKQGGKYLVEYLTYQGGYHKGVGLSHEDKKPEWIIHRGGGAPVSCRDFERVFTPRLSGLTLEQMKDLLTAEAVAEWQKRHEELQVKPLAIAEILARTNLRERDLQATPEPVLVALRDALTREKVGA